MEKKVEELRQYVLKRVNENVSSSMNVDDAAIQSHTRDIVQGIMKSLSEDETSGFKVVCDSSNNPQYNIDNNILTMDLLITDPSLAKIILEGNNDVKTSVGFIQTEAIVSKDV